MFARQRIERQGAGREKKAPRAGRACIFDNYSTVDLRADGLRTAGGPGRVETIGVEEEEEGSR